MKNILIPIIMLCVLSLSSCATTYQGSSAKAPLPLEAQHSMKLTDIPIPAGFKFLRKTSYSFQSDNTRMGVLRYSGRKSIDLVFNFFQDQMPAYDWNLKNSVEYGIRLLNFEREGESCIITLEPKTFSTLITITIGPVSDLEKNKAEEES